MKKTMICARVTTGLLVTTIVCAKKAPIVALTAYMLAGVASVVGCVFACKEVDEL